MNSLSDFDYFYPRWIFAWDANGDGVVSITDVISWFWYVLYAPGDGLIYLLSRYDETRTFFELTPNSYYSGWSLAVSIIVWATLLMLMASEA
jgi:hypothetical protein